MLASIPPVSSVENFVWVKSLEWEIILVDLILICGITTIQGCEVKPFAVSGEFYCKRTVTVHLKRLSSYFWRCQLDGVD